MNMRNAVLGLAVVFGVSFWAWYRPCAKEAQAHTSEGVVIAEGSAGHGNLDEAASRYRMNQARHWKQIAIGH